MTSELTASDGEQRHEEVRAHNETAVGEQGKRQGEDEGPLGDRLEDQSRDRDDRLIRSWREDVAKQRQPGRQHEPRHPLGVGAQSGAA